MAIFWGENRRPPTSVELFAFAGGGGGGDAAGGGAGGFLYASNYPVTRGTTYTIAIGAGGGGSSGGGLSGTNGSNSSLSIPVTSIPHSFVFDGSGDAVTFNATGDFLGGTFFGTNKTFTVEAWLYQTNYVTETNYYNCILADASSLSGSFLCWGCVTDTSNRPALYWYDGVGKAATGSTALTLNTWNHVAWVVNAGVVSIYVNGVSQTLSGTTTLTNPTQSAGMTIGAERGRYYTGYISNLRAVKNTALYTTNFTTPTEPLTAITNTILLTAQNSTGTDNSTNNFSLVANGNAAVARTSPFTTRTAGFYSAYFDGSGDSLQVPSTASVSGTGNFTVELWLYPISFGSSYQAIMANDTSSGWSFTVNSTGTLSYGRSLVATDGTTAGSVVFNAWNHIAWVRSGTGANQFICYINGIVAGTFTNSTSYVAGIIRLGTDGGGSAFPFNGYISNLRINTGIIYTSRFTPSFQPLTAITNTSLLICQNNTFVDNSTNNFTITRNGNTIPFNLSPFDNPIAIGGGGGGSYSSGTNSTAGGSGGSGGGGPLAGNGQGKAAGSGIIGQGFAGGAGHAQDGAGAGGGGGGAGGVGGSASANNPGRGGIGTQPLINDNGWSTFFDGSSDYLTATTGNLGSGDFTVEYWVYHTSFYNFITNVSTTRGSTGWNCGTQASAQIVWYSSGVEKARGTTAMAVNTWNHVAFVRSGGVIKGYLNGVQNGTTSTETTNFTNTNLAVGRLQDATPGEYHTGYMSNLRITVGQALYTANFTPSTSPLTAIAGTSLLTCQNSTIRDNSANNFTLTVNGDVAARRLGPFNPLGVNSFSGYFDGTGDSLTVPANAALSLGSGDYTVEVWVYLTGAQTTSFGWGVIGTYPGSGNGWSIAINQSNNGHSVRWGISNTLIAFATTPFIPIGTWTHIAVTRSGTGTNNTKIFINGVIGGQATDNTNDTFTGTLYIGSQGLGQYLTGYISNARIVKGTAVYTSNFTVPTTPLTAITNTVLLTCQNSTFIDNSSNNFTITTTGDAVVSPHHPFLEHSYFAAGGGAGASNGTTSAGGLGRAGSQSAGNRNAVTNSGSGGGGSAGNGGSGITMIRYSKDKKPAASTTGNPTVTEDSTNRIYTWISSGSITF